MNVHPKTIKKPTIKTWQMSLLALLVLVVAVFFGMRAVSQAPAKPLVIDPQNLTQTQLTSLQSAVAPIGEVRFFSADLTAIQHLVSQLSWVESASVKRDWQEGVVVSVVPRQAVANFGSQHLLDASGQVFVPADEHELMDRSLVHLYSSHSKDAGEMMKQMRQINEWFAPLGMTAQDVTLTSRQTWLIRFDNGLRVIVDHENTEQKLFGLSTLLQSSLAADLPKIQSVDLRYKNGFAIAWKGGAIQATSKSGA